MAFATVTITPTLDDSTAYASGDVLFLNTVVLLPARSCKLVQGFVIDFGGSALISDQVDFLFFQNNTAELGTINATANISDANFRLNRFIGACKIETGTEVEGIDGVAIHSMVDFVQPSDTSGGRPLDLPLVSSGASAPYNNAGAFPVFMSAVISQTTGSDPDFTSSGANALDIVLLFEY